MKVTFKAYAMLSDYLPDAARRTNAVDVEVPEGTTVIDLIERFRLPRAMCHLVLIDGNFVPPAQRDGRVLRAGETLAVWPPIAGG
ncbi:MAG: MoaD/ThiS family protein [Rhodocyclaceae bacterium]|nr:MoaD/ThiS family protein [Rhodocyclaceae bacterium]